jgi:mono/diheme cytochrome c family protein
MLRRAPLLLTLAALFGLTLAATPSPQPVDPAAPANPPPAAPHDSASIRAGAKLFTQFCQTCHGKTGLGDGPTGKVLNPRPRNFQKPSEYKTKNDQEMFKVITKGGQSMGLSPLMVAWGAVLKEEQVWQVIAFIRTLPPPAKRAGS